jgi:6-phospho-beta-glucosidase
MASIKLAYIGGGSTRAPGTVASIIHQGKNFDGSELVLIDLNEEKLKLVKTIGDKLAKARGIKLNITTTTDRKAGLRDCDAVLTSFRPGGFEARYLDESIPLKHGVIGQETQGPGGFFMALRSIHVMQGIIKEMEKVCTKAILFNYTNPINLVSEAVTHHTDIPIYSLCEGPLLFPPQVAEAAGLEPEKISATMIGLNHASWSVEHHYEGGDLMVLVQKAYDRKRNDSKVDVHTKRLLHVTAMMESIPPAEYFQYYFFKDDILADLQQKTTTRSQDIMALVPDYWKHYQEQAKAKVPELNPKRSRGGIYELELALDVMDAMFNNRKEVLPVNLPNQGAIADFPDDLVVEVPCFVDRHGVTPLSKGHVPKQVAGLLKMLGEYQSLAGEAAWCGTRKDAIRALASNPLVLSLNKAETLYDEMSHAHRAYLPKRLLKS